MEGRRSAVQVWGLLSRAGIQDGSALRSVCVPTAHGVSVCLNPVRSSSRHTAATVWVVTETGRSMNHVETDRNWWERVLDLASKRRAAAGLFAVSIVGFVVLAVLVGAGTSWIIDVDQSVQAETFELRSPWINEMMIWVTRLGSRWVIGSLLLILTFWVVRTGRCRKALMVMAIAFMANPFLELILKSAVGRERPTLMQLVPGNGPAFPSGHVLATVGFYGVLAAVVWQSSRRRIIQYGGYAVATAIILSVGFSRTYLGVHWFSDVVGGLMIGTAFVIAVGWSLQGHHLGGDIGCDARSLDPAQ